MSDKAEESESKEMEKIEKVKDFLKKNHNIILRGGNGVGKTFTAKEVAKKILKKDCPDSDIINKKVEDGQEVPYLTLINLHKGFDYNEFVQGTNIYTEDNDLVIQENVEKIFKKTYKAAKAAANNKNKKFVLILDDIHRVNVNELFGECMAYFDEKPLNNLFIIATLNTTVANENVFDFSIYRKFYTWNLYSDIEYILTDDPGTDIFDFWDDPEETYKRFLYYKANSIVRNYLNYPNMDNWLQTYERYKIGHGYFSDYSPLKLRYQVVPLLQQYFEDGILVDYDGGGTVELNSLLYESCDEVKMLNEVNDNIEEITQEEFEISDSGSGEVINSLKTLLDLGYLPAEDVFSSVMISNRVIQRIDKNENNPFVGNLYGSWIRKERLKRKIKKNSRKANKYREIEYRSYQKVNYYCPSDINKNKQKVDYKSFPSFVYKQDEFVDSQAKKDVLISRMWFEYFYKYCYLLKQINEEKYKELVKKFEELLGSSSDGSHENEKIHNKNNTDITEGFKSLFGDNKGVKRQMEDKSIFKIMEETGINQVVLHGPPGTSKTYEAKEEIKKKIEEIKKKNEAQTNEDNLNEYKFSNIDKSSNDNKKDEICWDIVQFHPSYSYEDFVRGITVKTEPESPGNNDSKKIVTYHTVNKILGEMAKYAEKNKGIKCILIIDEINRANIANVLGELIYALEYRGEEVATPYELDGEKKNTIEIPENMYLIGTMNTADKSIGNIDYAIRRRFLFIRKLPDKEVIKKYYPETNQNNNNKKTKQTAIMMFETVSKLFEKPYLNPEYNKEDVQVGHTYFLAEDYDKLWSKFQYQVLPLLHEYINDGIIEINEQKTVEIKEEDEIKVLLEALLKYFQINKDEKEEGSHIKKDEKEEGSPSENKFVDLKKAFEKIIKKNDSSGNQKNN